MKLKKETKFFAGIVMLLFAPIFLMLSWTLLAQERTNDSGITPLNDEMMATEPVKVVKEFWELSEKGEFEKAKKLRTNSIGDFSFEVNRNSKIQEREEIIYNLGLSLISVEQVEIINKDKWEIAVKVKEKDGREFYLFHIVVKNGDSWKIFATTR